MSSNHRRDRGPPSTDIRISKALSYTLRHGATKEDLPIRSDGFASVSALLSLPKFRSLNLDFPTLQRIVADNDKQRYTMREASDGWEIRANQGHSMEGVTELELALLEYPGALVHGTFYGAYEAILESGGLSRMGRRHVHLAEEQAWRAGEGRVMSGMRGDAEVVVVVDADRAVAEGGLRFWRSVNGVVLTEGDARGFVELRWVMRIEERRSGDVLWQDGEKRKELPENLKNRPLLKGKEHVRRGGGGKRGRGRGRGRGDGGGEGGGEREVDAGDV